MLKWLKNLFTSSELDKKKKQLELAQQLAFEAQRNGDLRKAGKFLLEAEAIEKEILEIQNENR